MDRIFINDLQAFCLIGVNENERNEKQEIVIEIALYLDLRPAGRSDILQQTIDYSTLADDIVLLAEQSSYILLEALAENIADRCLVDSRVQQVQVIVTKPMALRSTRGVGVEINRVRKELADES
jgi:FolB domain-containing protein